MRRRPIPDFEDWRQYIFEHAHSDFIGEGHVRPEVRSERVHRFTRLDPLTTTQYLERLFRESAQLANRFSKDQIAKATWRLFLGDFPDSIHCLWHESVPAQDAEECLRSLKSLYTDCFDRLCEPDGTSSGSAERPSRDLEIAVYMLWDMGPLDLRPCRTGRGRRLGEAALDVIEVALLQCQTEACRSSALHAIGHGIGILEFQDPKERDPALEKEFVRRVNDLVQRFLEIGDVTPLLRKYAAQALTGNVM